MIKVKRALISVSDKKGLVPFAKGLHALGVEIVSTGGTSRQLKAAGIPVIEVSDYTGFPEMLDGRVKTLHPKIHGGLLAVRDNKEHMTKVAQYEIGLIDMVVINLYPFEKVTQKKNVSLDEAIENIDIGGPAMLRSGAKNYKSVAVLCRPERYVDILKELEGNAGLLSDTILYGLALEVFEHTARYDGLISRFLQKRVKSQEFSSLPSSIDLSFTKMQDLRYGENPHQAAAFYKNSSQNTGFAQIEQVHGKELSFNNILDLNAAVSFVRDFSKPAAVVIKHNNPTGVAEDATLAKAYVQAWKGDKLSAFGGIIGLNRKVDVATAELIYKSGFMECVIAPGFAKGALKVLTQKKNLRLIVVDPAELVGEAYDYKMVAGGVLVQERDDRELQPSELRCVTKKKPTKAQVEALLFGWKVIRNVKSNAIILVKGKRTVGIGCGQTSRVESVHIAIRKAGSDIKNAMLVSDAFLPKTDNVELAAKAGIKVIIQTGGSIADADVIATADKAGIAMVMTGVRHFKH